MGDRVERLLEVHKAQIDSGGARVFAARGKRLCCRRPPPLIRSAIDILMGTGTTMALVWTVNSTLILECNCLL